MLKSVELKAIACERWSACHHKLLYTRVSFLLASRVFYVAILPLIAFYSLFATVLYPAAAYLHPHGMYESLAAYVPVGLHGLLKVF